jgi:hypothetical protein
MSYQSHLFGCQCNLASHWSRVNYVEYNNFCIKGKIIILMNITCVDYVKMLPWGPNTCILGWTFKRKLNATTRRLYWIFFRKKISIIHLTNYINLNDANRWARKNLWRIFHVISWNILNILVCHVEILCDMAKYFMEILEYFVTSHVWFVLKLTMVYWL